MSKGKTALKFFGMFDKVDDIVYEPMKLVCDTLRQPIKQLDIYNDKKKSEHAQELEMQLKQFEADLEYERQRREMKLAQEKRGMEEEINQMICDNDLRRREEMVQLEEKYRKEMAVSISKGEGNGLCSSSSSPIAFTTGSISRPKASSSIYTPLIWILSRYSYSVGEINLPIR